MLNYLLHNQFKYFTALPGFWNVYICKVDRRNSQIRICTNQRVLEHIVVKKYFQKWNEIYKMNGSQLICSLCFDDLKWTADCVDPLNIHIIISKTCSKHWKNTNSWWRFPPKKLQFFFFRICDDICTWLCHDCSNIQFESTQHLSWSEKMPLKYLYSKENVWRKKKEGVENK